MFTCTAHLFFFLNFISELEVQVPHKHQARERKEKMFSLRPPLRHSSEQMQTCELFAPKKFNSIDRADNDDAQLLAV